MRLGFAAQESSDVQTNKESLTYQTLQRMANHSSRSEVECNGNGRIFNKYAEIIVIRHGETDYNVARRIQGQLDVDLNDVGRQQALVVADRLSKEPKISAIYSSDLKRAYETAETIAKSCGVLEVIKVMGLRERHLGDLQDVMFDGTAKANPEAHKAFTSNDQNLEIPGGGESLNQVYKRCTSALEIIAKKHQGERVVVVSHGGPIQALHRRGRPHGNPRPNVPNGAVNIFQVSENDEWSVVLWGDVSHMKRQGVVALGFSGYSRNNSGKY